MRMKMKRVFRRNQIIITTLAIMIAAAGYLNYAGKSDLPGADTYEAGATKISDSDIYSENQAVSGSVADGEYEEIASLDDPGEGDPLAAGSEEGIAQGAADGDEASADNPAVDNPGEAVLTGGTGVAEYIANVQLSREQIRAKNREALNALINNENLDASAKEAAVQDMLALNAIAEKENAAETLLMAKGFADPVVSITDGKVDVVVNAPSITDPQRAQIEDIVKRKTGVAAESIVITPLSQSKEAADDNTSDAPDTAADAAGAENATDTKDTAGGEGNEAQDTAASAESDPADSGSEDKETAAGAQNDPTIDTEGIYD